MTDFSLFDTWRISEDDHVVEWLYCSHTYVSFAVGSRPLGDDFEGMLLIIACPFCPATIGAPTEQDIIVVKEWMGKHLANFHEVEVETQLLRNDQLNEYGGGALVKPTDRIEVRQ
jgi:hypothetical protein